MVIMIKQIISALWLVGQAAKTPASHAGNAGSIPARVTIVGVDCDEDPPVPIPNTEVKLISAENTWLEAARENRSVPILIQNAIPQRDGILLFRNRKPSVVFPGGRPFYFTQSSGSFFAWNSRPFK